METIDDQARTITKEMIINTKAIVATFLLGVLLSGCATSQMKQSALFPEWKPNVDQPIGQLEEVLAKLEQQQPMNDTIANISFLYDTKLLMLIQDFIAHLPESVRASQISEQQEWLKQREKLTSAAAAKYDGGTGGPFAVGMASIETTKKRISEIKKRMNEFPAAALRSSQISATTLTTP
jgi:uncharacterized protein YecT (DUF1311 family)